MTMPSKKKLFLAVLIPVQVVSARLAWRDLAQRSEDQVKGSKTLWRGFVLLNPGNWLFGRR
ncbi:hypothetical protein ACEZCY_35710 [Streptacidiphilus sp. N1-12]|uniref:Uncharacterized protein n=1 Tax=Streptacidiphilus alkalitolerans TaxID=3342712 RepID=A0ABV6WRF1_9ACTN